MRLFITEKTYDYKTINEALKHMEKMKQNGYEIQKYSDVVYIDNTPIFENGEDEFPYSIKYQKY